MPDAATPDVRFVRVWDLPVRLFHWLLVALLGFSWWSGESHLMDWHRRSGYAIVALLIFRIYWGFFGSTTARFAGFVRGPRTVVAYARSLRAGAYAGTIGHNPIGGWSVIVMLATLAVMVAAGLFSVDVDGLESGPLADYVSFDRGRAAAAVHHAVFNILLALVAVHVVAILFYLVRLRNNLIAPMVNGRRPVDTTERHSDPNASAFHVTLGVLIAAACTYAIARSLRF